MITAIVILTDSGFFDIAVRIARAEDRDVPVNTLTAEQRELVDEFGKLFAEVAALDLHRSPKVKRLDELKPVICAWYPHQGATETQMATGYDYEVQIGERANVKSWKSLAAISRAAGGWKELQKICIITFKALSGLIGNTEAEALQVEANTGTRRIKAAPVVAVPCERELPKAA